MCSPARRTDADKSWNHRRETGPTPETRFTLGNVAERYQDRYWHERAFLTVEALRQVVEARGLSLTSVALAWVLTNPAITAPIVGASRPEQLRETLKAFDLKLEPDLVKTLHELTLEYRRGDAER